MPRSPRGSVCERVARVKSSKRRRSDRRCGRRARPRAAGGRARSTSATSDRVELLRASAGGARPSARCAPIEPPPPADAAPAAGRGCARARAAGARTPWPSSATSAVSSSSATWRDGLEPARAQLRSAVIGPTPQSALDRQRVQERRARRRAGRRAARRAWPTPLATLARNFVRATPTVIGSPTRSRTSRRSRARDLAPACRRSAPCPRTSRNASSIDSPSTSGDVSLEDARRRPCSPRRTPSSAAARRSRRGHSRRACAAAHRRPDAVRLRLVAGGEHDARRRR